MLCGAIACDRPAGPHTRTIGRGQPLRLDGSLTVEGLLNGHAHRRNVNASGRLLASTVDVFRLVLGSTKETGRRPLDVVGLIVVHRGRRQGKRMSLVEPTAQINQTTPLTAKWRRRRRSQINRTAAGGTLCHTVAPGTEGQEPDEPPPLESLFLADPPAPPLSEPPEGLGDSAAAPFL